PLPAFPLPPFSAPGGAVLPAPGEPLYPPQFPQRDMAFLPDRSPETRGRGSIAPNRPDGRFDRIPRPIPISPSPRTQQSGPGPRLARSPSAIRDLDTGPRNCSPKPSRKQG